MSPPLTFLLKTLFVADSAKLTDDRPTMKELRIIKLRSFLIAVSISVLHFAVSAKADSQFGAVSGSTGRAGVAANDNGEQIFMNPAAMVHGKSFVHGYFYRRGTSEEDEENDWLGLTIQDNSENVFLTGGFLYGQESRTFQNLANYKERRIQVSVAKFVTDHISMGLSAYNIRREVFNDKEYEFYDGDLGLLWNPHPQFAIGAKYDNWAKHGDEAPDHVQLKDRLTIGANYVVLDRVRARLDLSQQLEDNPEDRVDFRTGLESFIDTFFVLRFGFERDQLADRKYYSAGMGFTGPRLRIDYSYRKNADYSGGALHSVDFRIPF